jgi:WXG100 family type VII secretion target
MADFKVNTEAVAEAAGKLKTTAGNISTELDRARTTVSAVGGEWTGDARRRFDTLMAEWDKVAKEQQQNLQEIGELLAKAGAFYAETEGNISQAFGA